MSPQYLCLKLSACLLPWAVLGTRATQSRVGSPTPTLSCSWELGLESRSEAERSRAWMVRFPNSLFPL